MNRLVDSPPLLFLASLIILWGSAWLGMRMARQSPELDGKTEHDVGVVLAATLTLLGLVIGFSFSMAISRYDQRKNFEEAEANSIGTEFVRADLLPAEDAGRVRLLLKRYLEQRVRFYTARNGNELQGIKSTTDQLQIDLWAAVRGPADAHPTPLIALVVSGMNDVLNSQGYTQAAWWNRIPMAAWALMILIAVLSNVLIGFSSPKPHSHRALLLVLPVVLSISFFLIADIDSPRRGIIHVVPQNLLSVADSLR
jgi:hypothetical protein